MSESPQELIVPDADQFREWLIKVSEILQVRPARLATDSGSPVNSVGKFIKGNQRELHLTTAHNLHSHVMKLSRARGVAVPRLQVEVGCAARSGACDVVDGGGAPTVASGSGATDRVRRASG